MVLRPLNSTLTYTLFPYTTLFRSCRGRSRVARPRAHPCSHPRCAAPVSSPAPDRRGRNKSAHRCTGETRNSRRLAAAEHGRRSEEHTSELQTLMRILYAVFCLKKKKQNPKMLINKTVRKQ